MVTLHSHCTVCIVHHSAYTALYLLMLLLMLYLLMLLQAPGSGDIRLTVEAVPEAVAVEATFSLRVKIANCSERTMDLVLNLQNGLTSSVCWCGVSGRSLGKLQPGAATHSQLSLIALSPGLHVSATAVSSRSLLACM